jgi:hypothetical protein
MDRASQTEAVLQKKELLSSSVSQNSVDIDNPVPQEGGLEKVSGAIKKYLLLTLRCADPGCYSRAGQGQVPVTLSMPCHCGGTGTTEWGRFSSHRSLACGILVHPSTAQPRGSKIASSNVLCLFKP